MKKRDTPGWTRFQQICTKFRKIVIYTRTLHCDMFWQFIASVKMHSSRYVPTSHSYISIPLHSLPSLSLERLIGCLAIQFMFVKMSYVCYYH